MKSCSVIRVSAFFVLTLMSIFATSCDDTVTDAELIHYLDTHLNATCCWQPISQHESPVAEQMRKEVRTMVASGMSREEILDHFVALHGERVLATPLPEGFNILAYILPWVALIFGVWFVFVMLKRLRAPDPVSPSPSKEPDARYASLIEKELKDLEEK